MLDTLSIWASIPGIACSEVQRGSWSWSSYTVISGTYGFWEEEGVVVVVVVEKEDEVEVEVEGEGEGEGEEEEEEEEKVLVVLVVVVVD